MTGMGLIETDHLLSHNCRELFLNVGEQKFRELEREVVLSLKNVKNSILSLGGGTLLDERNVSFLRNIGTLVYLDVPKETLRKRILVKPLPSFFQDENSFEKIYAERIPLLEKIPALRIEIREKNEDQVLSELKEIIYGK